MASAFVRPQQLPILTASTSSAAPAPTTESSSSSSIPTGALSMADTATKDIPYGETSRSFRRTVYSHDDWVKHRSPDRFLRNLWSIPASGIYKVRGLFHHRLACNKPLVQPLSSPVGSWVCLIVCLFVCLFSFLTAQLCNVSPLHKYKHKHIHFTEHGSGGCSNDRSGNICIFLEYVNWWV